jgi:hypothetical protein
MLPLFFTIPSPHCPSVNQENRQMLFPYRGLERPSETACQKI